MNNKIIILSLLSFSCVQDSNIPYLDNDVVEDYDQESLGEDVILEKLDRTNLLMDRFILRESKNNIQEEEYGEEEPLQEPIDYDGDGWLSDIDCDDYNSFLNHNDYDEDGYSTCEGDCLEYQYPLNQRSLISNSTRDKCYFPGADPKECVYDGGLVDNIQYDIKIDRVSVNMVNVNLRGVEHEDASMFDFDCDEHVICAFDNDGDGIAGGYFLTDQEQEILTIPVYFKQKYDNYPFASWTVCEDAGFIRFPVVKFPEGNESFIDCDDNNSCVGLPFNSACNPPEDSPEDYDHYVD